MSELKVYAVKLKDKETLGISSSGGAFTALSNVFLEDGNAVVCAVYDYSKHDVHFQIATSFAERDMARGSKYLQAESGYIYRDCVKWLQLNPGKKLVFFGLGCQAASFRNYMKVSRLEDRVVVVDIICHGAPSQLIWKEYIKDLPFDGEIMNVNFRNKKNGWNHSIGTAVINGQEISIQDYRRLYSTKNIIRPCCYNCPYTRINRDVDITIGDYWHIEKKMPEFYDPMGVSLLLVHSEKGDALFEYAKKYFDYAVSNEHDCWQLNLERPTDLPASREVFWKEYYEHGINYVINKYGRAKSIPKRAVNKFTRTVKSVLGY